MKALISIMMILMSTGDVDARAIRYPGYFTPQPTGLYVTEQWRTELTKYPQFDPTPLWNSPVGDQYILDGAAPFYTEPSALFESLNFSSSTDFQWDRPAWIVVANNEPSMVNSRNNRGLKCDDPSGYNSGPPNQSFPVGKPYEDIFGVEISPTGGRLVLDTVNFESCKSTFDYIPFLSFGQQKGFTSQTNEPITVVSSPVRNAKTLSFNVTINDTYDGPVSNGRVNPGLTNGVFVYIEGNWDGIKRWAFILLSGRGAYAPPLNAHALFNWNLKDTMYYPGADIIFMTVDNPIEFAVGKTGSFEIDIEKVFYDNRNKFVTAPRQSISITGIHFAVEHTVGKNITDVTFSNISLK